jgi:DNA modification methylase
MPRSQPKIEHVDPATLVPDPQNPRKIKPAAREKLKRGLKEEGWVGHFIAALKSTRMIVSGHQRHSVALELKNEGDKNFDTVPVQFIDMDEARARAVGILVNNPEAQGEWDLGKLPAALRWIDAQGADATRTGFDDRQLERLFSWQDDPEKPKEEDESQELPLPAQPTSITGETYELGRHCLICGDATKPETWDKLLRGKQADLIWTDPPYGVKYVGVGRDREMIENDDLPPAKLEILIREALSLALIHSKPGAGWYVAAPGGPKFHIFGTVLLELGVWRQTLQWVKDALVMGRSDYHHRNEPIFMGASPTVEELVPDEKKATKRKGAARSQPLAYGWKPGAAHHFVKDRTLDTIWEVPKPRRSDEHPTMKPVELIRRALRASTEPGQIVVDCFGGSGSTLIAAEQTGRTALLIEKDRKYCDVIRHRFELYQAASGR